jgi:glycosyltransferase involved in cell wall biosynthesis
MHTQSRRLRLALVATSLRLGGAEKQTVYMARALFHAGMDVRLFYLGDGGHYEAALREMGLPVSRLYVPNRPWTILARLIGALRRFRPHLVLVNQFGDLRYGAIAGRFCKALTLGGVRSDGWYELRAHGRAGRLTLRLTHGFIANSHRAKQALVSQSVKPQKIEVLSNVIDLQDSDTRSALPLSFALPSGRLIAVAVGSLQPGKRFDRFLEALALARRSEPTLAGVIAGADYGVKAALQQRAQRLGLGPPDLVFLGECDCVPALLARSAYLVLSSDFEGLPNVVVEAMAARLPVITTPAGDAGVVVQHGKTGFVVPPDDTQGMAAFMVKLAQSPSLRTEMGEAGRKRVEQEYDYELLAERLVAIFHRFARQQRRTILREILEHDVSVRNAATISPAMLVEGPA